MSTGYILKKAQQMLRLKMDQAIAPLTLTTPQYAVLARLEESPGISNADLARDSFITPQTMHSIVANLEKKHLVKRKQSPEHGRILCTQLTSQGKLVVKKAHSLVESAEKKMLRSISAKSKKILEALLLECIDNLQQES